MKQTFCLVLFALVFVSLAQALQVGDRLETVTREAGQPVAIRKKTDGVQVWKLKDGRTVWLANGVVQNISTPRTGSSIFRGGAPVQIVAYVGETPVETTASPSAKAVDVQTSEDLLKPGYLLVLAGIVVLAVAKIRFCTRVFKASGWRVLGFLIPLVPLAFVFTRWKDTKRLLTWQLLVALPLIALGFYLNPVDRSNSEAPSKGAVVSQISTPLSAAH